MLRKRIGDILIDLKIISEEQLLECLKEQKKTGKLLGQVLLDQGAVSTVDLARALAAQVEVPFIEVITEQMANLELLRKAPLKFLRQHYVIPIMFEGQKTIVTANPRDLQPLDDLALLMAGDVRYAVATEQAINDAINKYYPLETGGDMMEELKEEEEGEFGISGDIEEKDIMEMANEAPIVKLVNHILFQAAKEKASDIHIEAYEKELRVRYRIDGNLYQRMAPPKRFHGAIVSRIKIMSNMNIAEKRLPQDGRIMIKVADTPLDLRVSILPTNFGEKVVMRLLYKAAGTRDLSEINLSERDYASITDAIQRPNGIILVSGPTGSGKTTTLYSMLTRLNEPDVNLVTVEDPVEYTINGINQVNVNAKIGLTFAAALRSILRQDPDVVLIGEIRDAETAQIATQAALTGHLVLSTIHTNSAPATITRLIDMGIEPFLIAASLACVISQRLVRRLCNKCKEAYEPTSEMLHRLGLTPEKVKGVTFYRPVGCDDCLQNGYKGRLPIFEVMEITDQLSPLIIRKADVATIRNKAMEQGMTQLIDDGIRGIKDGHTTIEEVLSVAHFEDSEQEISGPVEA